MFGFQRGWKREMISLAVIIASLLFLSLGGGPAVAFLLFVGVPFLFQAIQNGAQKTGVQVQSLASPDSTAILVTTIVCFFLIIGLGYAIGKRIVDKPSKPVEHFLGLIPAAISGYILTTYVLGAIPLFAGLPLFSSQLMKVDLSLPSFLFIFVGAVLVVAAALIAGGRKKTGAVKK